jgi:hypothetical protein
LVRFAADKLNVPTEFLTTEVSSEPAPRASENGANGDAPRPASPPSIDAVARVERAFLAMCVADRANGLEYLERLDDDHFSSGALRRVCEHLVRHFDDPLAALPADDPSLSALVTEVAMRGQEEKPSADALRLTFLQLEFQRVQRQLRHAERDGDLARQRELWPARESVKVQIDELMGQVQ